MTKTVKDHFKDCRSVSDVIDNANALLTKTKSELEAARRTLEALAPYQHPLHRVEDAYVARLMERDRPSAPADVIAWQIQRINALLGDRA